jgi:excinuclease ABC subunit C
MRGNFAPVKAYLRDEMERYAENLEYERAAEIKDKLTLFEDYQSKSMVVSVSIKDIDVFAYFAEGDEFISITSRLSMEA